MKTTLLLLALVGACLGNALPGGISEDAVKPMPLLRVDPLPGVPAQKPERIINGTPAAEGQFPFVVAMHLNNAWFCGGSLITPCTILTVAHCTNGMDIATVYIGSITLWSGLRIETRDYAQRPDADVALVYLPSPVTGPNIGLVAGLAPSNAGNYAGEAAIAIGWGSTKEGVTSSGLHWVTVNIITPELCAWYYGPDAGTDWIICSQGPGNNGVCRGDGGGPLIQASTGIQIGIISFAALNACEAGYPSGYARVSNVRDWIDANTRYC